MYLSGLLIMINTLSQNYSVFEDDEMNSLFQLGDYDLNSCEIPQLQKIYNTDSKLETLFIQELFIQSDESFSLSYNVSNVIDNDYLLNQQEQNLQINESTTIYISHICPNELENSNFWGLIKVELILNDEQLIFYYESLCNIDYSPNKFDFSYMIIVLVGVLFVYLLSRFGQIASLPNKKFQGFHINYLYFIGFVTIMFIIFGLSFIQSQPQKYILSIITYFSNIFYLIDICCFFQIHFQKSKNIIPFYIIGWLLGSIPIILYYIFGQSWYINDIAFIFNLGTFFKLFKVVSFKDCITIYTPFLIFYSFLNYAVYLKVKFGTELANILNLAPFFSLQAPMFNYIPTRKCAFIEINTLFLPGLMIAYTIRYAKASQSYVYFIIYFLGMLLGLICWLAITFTNSQYQITSLLFTIIPSSILSLILFFYRNESKAFFFGLFYDSILDDPFRISKELKQSMKEQDPTKQNTELVTVGNELPIINPNLFADL